MALRVDADRFADSFEEYSAIGGTENGGLHRLSLSDADARVRNRFRDDLESDGLTVRVDEVGNMFARRPGTDDGAKPVLIGSHLDSQPYGGRFDGQLGVLTALETLRTFDDEDVETNRPVEIVNWTNEEGSRFQPSMLGSGAFTGRHSVEDALAAADADGVTVGEELERIGYAGSKPCEAFDTHAYLELHIEQGPRLANQSVPVGVVTGVFGQAWLRATVTGEADHAGPTPMENRTDALVASVDAIQQIGTLPQRLSRDAVATVGELTVEPNSINVIPERVEFTVDARSYNREVVREAVSCVERELESASSRHGTTYELTELADTPPIEFSMPVRDAIRRATEAASVEHRQFVSGAGHDAQHLQEITDAGMIFVPSEDGRTHAEAEFTSWDDAVAGANVFTNAVRELATT